MSDRRRRERNRAGRYRVRRLDLVEPRNGLHGRRRPIRETLDQIQNASVIRMVNTTMRRLMGVSPD